MHDVVAVMVGLAAASRLKALKPAKVQGLQMSGLSPTKQTDALREWTMASTSRNLDHPPPVTSILRHGRRENPAPKFFGPAAPGNHPVC